jgi:hypothetical protein
MLKDREKIMGRGQLVRERINMMNRKGASKNGGGGKALLAVTDF